MKPKATVRTRLRLARHWQALGSRIRVRHFAKATFDAGYVQASDREDTGKASGVRDSQIDRAHAARRLNHPPRLV